MRLRYVNIKTDDGTSTYDSPTMARLIAKARRTGHQEVGRTPTGELATVQKHNDSLAIRSPIAGTVIVKDQDVTLSATP